MSTQLDELQTAIRAVQSAGEILKSYSKKSYKIIRKTRHELVSEVDLEAQAAILQVFKESGFDYGVVTEEKTNFIQKNNKTWIVDPLDGTHNYVAGLPFSGVSVALAQDHHILMGAIYFPEEDLLFYATRGSGAFRNQKRIFVSTNAELSKAVVNYDNQFHLSPKSFDLYRSLVSQAFTTRIFGTATMDLCLIASGKIDGRIFLCAKSPDFAAGALIVTEAGGCLTNFDGTPYNLLSKQIIASNGKIHRDLLNIVKDKKT